MVPAKLLVISASKSGAAVLNDCLDTYQLMRARNGNEALQLLAADREMQVVLLDTDESQSSATLTFLRTLQDASQHADVRVIMLIPQDARNAESMLLQVGAADIVHKPFQKDMLLARVEIQLDRLRKQQLERRIEDQNLLFNAIFLQAPIGITISYESGPQQKETDDLFDVNPMFERITGRSRAELIRLGWSKITHPEDREEDLRRFKMLQAGEIASYEMEKRYLKPDGSSVWVHMVVAPLQVRSKNKYHHICLVQDISKRKLVEESLAESERSKSVLLSHLPGMAYRCNYDREWTMQFVSAGCFDLTGYHASELLHNRRLSFNQLIVAEYREPLWERWACILAEHIPFRSEYEIVTADGERKWVLELGQGIYDEWGSVEALEGIILDISERKAIEEDLTYFNEHDLLTGLFNRRYLESMLHHDAVVAGCQKRALLSVNLSSIHMLSIRYGFQYSQDLIHRLAKALEVHCSEQIKLFNSYEYRFVFYVKGYAGRQSLHDLCKSVSATLGSLLSIERIGWGIGVLEIDGKCASDVDLLLRNLLVSSEKALAQFEHEGGCCFFDKAMEEALEREEEITRELTEIAGGEFPDRLFLHFQPIVDLETDRISGFEALARLRCERLGSVSPLEFIPIAEKTKLIIPLGEQIIMQSLRFLRRLHVLGHTAVQVSINISAIQLLRNDFISNLFRKIRELSVDPQNITLEITESILAVNHQETNTILGELQALGIKIALDDFGTGYSSLSRERELHIDSIKIDKSFIDGLLKVKREEAITGDIISMAHKMGHHVIAEGIEHETQLQYLRLFGCDRIQGYLIGKPVDEDGAIALLGSS